MEFLVVDNDPVFIKIMEKILNKEGHIVSTAIDGLSALDILKTQRPDFIFIDYVMPNIDGGTLCKILKTDRNLEDSFIVVLSAVAAEEWSECSGCGADAYIAKSPFDVLKKHILQVVSDKESAREYCSRGNVFGIDEIYPRGITRELLTSKKHYGQLLNKMSEGVLELNSEHRIVYANPSALGVFNKPEHEILGMSIFNLFSDDQRPLILELANERGRDIHEHKKDRTISREGRHLTLKSTILDGSENHSLIMIEDVTDLKNSELSLRETNNFLNTILNSSEDYSIISTDLERNITFWNKGAETIFGYSTEETVGREKIEILYSERQDDEFAKHMEKILEEDPKTISFEVPQITKKGEKIWVEFHLSPRMNDSGKIVGTLAIGEDITEIKKLEEEREELRNQILHARKSESFGTLASGIAHDFNNLLMGIQGNVSLAKYKVKKGEPNSKNLDSLEESAIRMADLTEKLMQLAKGAKGPFYTRNFNTVIERSVGIFERGKGDISIEMDLFDDLWKVDVNESQISQALLNLFDNASNAMGGKGLMNINTRNRELNEVFFSGHRLRAGKYVEIEISDNGIGMDHRTIEKIFDPFFTTKPIGSEKGAGLGLATVYATIKNHRGMIRAKSKPGEGATFSIYLPASKEPNSTSDEKKIKLEKMKKKQRQFLL